MWFQRIFRLSKNADVKRPARGGGRGSSGGGLGAVEIRQLDRLQIRGIKALRGDRIGIRPSWRLKPSIEFKEYRSYVPGDDIRFVDWRATARHENAFVKQGEQPKDVIVYLLVDCSASMHWGRVPKSQTQLSLASALSYMALTHGDRLVIIPYGGGRNIEFGPASGKGYLPHIARYFKHLSYTGSGSLEQAVQLLKKRYSRGGVVFILSDLLESGNLTEILAKMPAPRWWVHILHLLHPYEIAPTISGTYELEDSETGKRVNIDVSQEALVEYGVRVQKWMSDLELISVENHAFYNLIETDWLLGEEVLPYLREHQVLVDL